MGFCRAISNSLAPQPRHFFFVLGLRPRTKKKCLGFGAILLDIALQNPICTLHIYPFWGLYIEDTIFRPKYNWYRVRKKIYCNTNTLKTT